jgi:nucleoside phosphorylase
MEDLSTLLAARKPKDRTSRYVILSALYCLNGSKRPVSAAEVSDLLKLHLGAKAPQKLATRLREYSGYAAIAEKGPPLKWKLKATGLQLLRKQSGLALASEDTSAQEFLTDVAIICALEQPEFEAVTEALGGHGCWTPAGDPRYAHVYRKCKLATVDGQELNVVGTTSTSMGLTAASIVTTQLVMQFRPKIVVMVGIAAGTRDGGKEFGDVLVADPSVDYNSGKVVWSDGVRGFLPDPYPISLNPRLRSVLLRFRGKHDVFAAIREGWNGPLPPRPNRLHVGPLGAADQVIDDATRILEIQKNWRKLIGVEMETYGVYRACYEAPDPKPRFVSFKAVCDFAAEKADSWQEYAAYVAAQFAVRFLSSEWTALWPHPITGGES